MLKELISRKWARGGMQRGTITKYQPFAPTHDYKRTDLVQR